MRNSLTKSIPMVALGAPCSGTTGLKYIKYTEVTFNFNCKT